MPPTLERKLLGGLLSSDEYLVDTWMLAVSYLYSALENGAELHLGCEVTDCDLEATSGLWTVKARKNPSGQTVSFTARVIVNCGGNYSDAIHKMLVSEEEEPFQITPGQSCTESLSIELRSKINIRIHIQDL